MKHLLLTTIAAVVLVGCGESQQSAPSPETKPVEPVAEAAKPEPPTAKAPDISIHEAAEEGNIETVKQHLAAGADVNAKDDDGYTPLDYAVPAGKEETADLLRKHGGISGAEDSIHLAAMLGNIEAVKQHLAAGTDVNAKNDYGSTPLHRAAYFGYKKVAELLIANGADMNAKDEDESTPLHYAAWQGYAHKELTELLIAKGADVNAKNNKGITPLDAAITRSHTEIADLLRKHGGKGGAEDSIHVAARIGNIKAVQQHLDAGADVNAKDEKGSTPLYWAAWDGYKKVAELLIAKGADVNAKNNRGITPLDAAIMRSPRQSRRPESIADLLRKHGGKTGEELKAEGK